MILMLQGRRARPGSPAGQGRRPPLTSAFSPSMSFGVAVFTSTAARLLLSSAAGAGAAG